VSAIYTFERFMKDVEWRVRRLALGVEDPQFVWPGLLILDVPAGLRASAFTIAETSGERDQLVRKLVATIKRDSARRFAWIMPCLREEAGRQVECLLIVFGEGWRAEAAIAKVVRRDGEPPRLGPFSYGAFGSGARRVSGRFVEPLLNALAG
jgi:hypothetical protein